MFRPYFLKRLCRMRPSTRLSATSSMSPRCTTGAGAAAAVLSRGRGARSADERDAGDRAAGVRAAGAGTSSSPPKSVSPITPGRAARALMAAEGTTGRAGTGATATATGTGAGGVEIKERTMGRVTGNSVSALRRRGAAAGSMGIWLLCSGSVAAKPRSAPCRGDTGWCATAPGRGLVVGAEARAGAAGLGATPTSSSSAASTDTSLTGLRCNGQPVPPSLLPTSSTLPGNSAYCTRCSACMLSALTSRICASITSSWTW